MEIKASNKKGKDKGNTMIKAGPNGSKNADQPKKINGTLKVGNKIRRRGLFVKIKGEKKKEKRKWLEEQGFFTTNLDHLMTPV